MPRRRGEDLRDPALTPGAAPTDLFVEANGLRHHLLEWPGAGLPILLVHGFLEHAHGFDALAPRLAAGGHRVLALDLRGHGDTDWVGSGGYYHFADYVADVALVLRALGLGRFALLGHSMGGNVAIQLAAAEPAKVAALALLEGIGPPFGDVSSTPERFESWIGELERLARRGPRSVASTGEAARRIAERWPMLGAENALHLVRHNVRREGGGLLWKFDPLHQTQGPNPYLRVHAEAFWRRIDAPVLFVEGSRSAVREFLPDLEERIAALGAEVVRLEGVGHHPHLEAPGATAETVLGFLARLGRSPA